MESTFNTESLHLYALLLIFILINVRYPLKKKYADFRYSRTYSRPSTNISIERENMTSLFREHHFQRGRLYVPFLTIVLLPLWTTLLLSQPIPNNSAALTILHWNDFHAQNIPLILKDSSQHSYKVGGISTLLGYINTIKRQHDNVALFDAGDDFQGTPISSLTYGRSQIELTGILHPDAMVLGNHEFDYGIDSLQANIARAQFRILCANVVNTETGMPLSIPYLIKMFGKIKIGIIGLSPPDLELLTLRSNLRGYRIRDLDSSITLSLHELKKREHPDLIILLSHMGLGEDTLLAERRDDIDIIVGGHDHIALFSPIKKNRTIIVQAGAKGQYLGKLDLIVDCRGDSIVKFTGSLVETRVDNIPPDSMATQKVADYENIVNAKLGTQIGTLLTRWDRRQGEKVEMNIGDFECDAMRAATGTDIAFHNVGGIRKDLDAGPILLRDIWEINPFGNTLITFTVTGGVLKKMIEFQSGVRTREFAQISGMRYVFDSSKPEGLRVVSIQVSGHPIIDSARYSLCSNNYMGSHIKEFFGIPSGNVHIIETGLIDRDVLIDYIKRLGTINSTIEGRIVDVSSNESQQRK